MASFFQPFVELLNGDAYVAHPGDASLPLGRRFAGRVLTVAGGGGTTAAWTQRVRFDRHGKIAELEQRSPIFKRGTSEWLEHLSSEAKAGSGWVVLLVEQQWQAALSKFSSESMGPRGVERMLGVREAVSQFGDDRLSEDVIRVAVDHPTMEGSIVAGVRVGIVQQLEREARGQGFQIAAVRVPIVSLLEHHFAQLAMRGASPPNSIVVYDGQSALIVVVRDGAFETSEGGISYVVNRAPADVPAQVIRRLQAGQSASEAKPVVSVIGKAIPAEDLIPTMEFQFRPEAMEVLNAILDDAVSHDFRSELEEMRRALPAWSRSAVLGMLLLILACFGGAAMHAMDGWQMNERAKLQDARRAVDEAALRRASERLAAVKAEDVRAHQMADWIDRNYHAQALLSSFLRTLPTEVSVDAVSVQASEGLPQAKFKFTLLGAEPSQRLALRSIENGLYALGYEIGRRDDPVPSSTRRGGVVYAWDLIMPSFGS